MPTFRRAIFWMCVAGCLPQAMLYAQNDSEVADPAKTPSAAAAFEPGSYRELVLADRPVAFWRMQESAGQPALNSAASDPAMPVGEVASHGAARAGVDGPRPPEFPLFPADNLAVTLSGDEAFLRVRDPGEQSPLDFDAGDSITVEAWVSSESVAAGSYVYLVGKGRTENPGAARDNQNFALRLFGQSGGGSAAVTFLFRSRDEADGKAGDWHRWTSKTGIVVGDGWHHVAISYTFGKPNSIRGYLDGEPVTGAWDMGGATERPPVVDNDELWIGSSMGGQKASSFRGSIDEVAIYRSVLPAERIKARFQFAESPLPPIDVTQIPAGQVLVQILENIPDKMSWAFRRAEITDTYSQADFAFTDVPNKYSPRGVKVDRSNPFLIRAVGFATVPAGKQRVLIRCRNASRVYLDDKLIAETKFHSIDNSGHGKVEFPKTDLAPHIRPLQRGDTEALVEIDGDGGRHLFRFEMIVGGRQHRPELGETAVCIGLPGEDFFLLSAADKGSEKVPLTDEAWPAFMAEQQDFLARLNAERRKVAGVEETAYWQRRHELAWQHIAALPPIVVPQTSGDWPAFNDIDRFINAGLVHANQQPTASIDDHAFLRRVTLDATGVIPPAKQIDEFFADERPDRRARWIDRLLENPRWADHWVGYWQDVLAENPNIVNPTLNNTGPFRWWIHESFLDNKPIDRFATELVMMEGSEYFGGPAGFGLATQNDAPMAAKAHILGQAFLAVQMKCARCHDAPYHDLDQADLFSLAALLGRGPQEVPKTSTVPISPDAAKSLLIEITLKAGEKVPPQWTFSEIADEEIPDGVLRNADDSRERLAALLTLPSNQRFARVIVNRLWKRLMGRGLVEPVDDWENATPSHPELLEYLARELMSHDYDLKHVTRLIMNSHVYQRAAVSREALRGEQPFLFAGPVVRRMSAEQLVDSLFVACEKPFDSDPICIDIDGARTALQSLHLGQPTRAWQFSSLSNERDRPSLALPFAQPFVTALETFGWRGSRQDPLTDRDEEPTALQPAILANGLLVRRVTRLSDDSGFTRLAIAAESPDDLIRRSYQSLLSRPPREDEQALFRELLTPGFDTRVVAPTEQSAAPARPRLTRNLVSWSNHLAGEASQIKIELQEAVRQGDPPTTRLAADWRDRYEDMLWSLINSPEFVFVP